MSISFNDAKPQSPGAGELMPANTIAPVRLSMRGIKKTNAGDAQMLDCEFVVTEGPFARRRFWGLMMITSNGSKGHNTAVDISKTRIRGILESAYGVSPTDESPEAMQARTIQDWSDLDGMEFLACIGIEKSKDPQYADKNSLSYAVTSDKQDYAGFKPAKIARKASPAAPAAQSNGAAANRPAWA